MGDDEAVLAELLRALADPVRLAVVDELGRGPRPAGELADVAGVSAPTMSKHLRTLLRAGVVTDDVHVYVDAETRRPVPIPEPIKAAVETLPRVDS